MINYKTLKTKDLEEINPAMVSTFCSSTSGGPLYLIYEKEDPECGKIAKFSWVNRNSWESWYANVSGKPKRVQHEHDICKYLYDNGVNVPEPHGVFKFKALEDNWREFGFFPRRFPAFVMQHLKGGKPNLKYMSAKEQRKMNENHQRELEKVRDLGVTPYDLDLENTIWIPEKEELYLIDFGKWLFQGESLDDF